MLDIDLRNLKPPYYIHSDIFNLRQYANSIKNIDTNFMQYLFDLLKIKLGEENLIFPSYNFDFEKTKTFNIFNDKIDSSLGSFPRWIWNNLNFVRSPVPLISCLTKNKIIKPKSIVYPFGKGSIFEYLYENDGSILLFGAPLIVTYIHYLEEIFIQPKYREIQHIKGKIYDNNVTYDCETLRTKRRIFEGNKIQYDWIKLERDLEEKNILEKIDRLGKIRILPVRKLSSFIIKKIQYDKNYLIKDMKKREFKN